MKSKTVRLPDGYRLNGDVVEFPAICRYDEDGLPDYAWVPSILYKIGARVMLVTHEDVSPNGEGRTVYSLISGAEDGIGGNSNPDITRYHGWRGTTNDSSCYAHGLRKITGIRELRDGTVAVTVGRDLLPDEE